MRDPVVHHVRVLFVAWLFTLVALTPPAWPQTPLDPQSLIGEWRGSWTSTQMHRARAASASGQYYLTIEKVEGNKVHGRAEIIGRTEFKFVGTLDGNRLTFGQDTITELVIDGDHMRGSSRGTFARDITLSKKK